MNCDGCESKTSKSMGGSFVCSSCMLQFRTLRRDFVNARDQWQYELQTCVRQRNEAAAAAVVVTDSLHAANQTHDLLRERIKHLESAMRDVIDSGPCHSDCFTATHLLEEALAAGLLHAIVPAVYPNDANQPDIADDADTTKQA